MQPAASRGPVWLSLLLATSLHAAALFAWRSEVNGSNVIGIDSDSIEVGLVEFAPTEPVQATPTEPEPPAPPPEPAPPPDPPMPLPEPPLAAQPEAAMVLPEPIATTPAPKATTPKPRSSAAAKPAASEAAAGRKQPGTAGAATTAARSAGTPVFLVRPGPVYPPGSRAARESGVVLLHITTNATGRPTAVDVAKSSGFPRLDRAAVEAAWRCRIGNASPGAQFETPVRFRLQR